MNKKKLLLAFIYKFHYYFEKHLSTMSDYNFDERICRNIMVDVRYVLFIVDKFAGAGHLVEEMDLVFKSPEMMSEEVQPTETID